MKGLFMADFQIVKALEDIAASVREIKEAIAPAPILEDKEVFFDDTEKKNLVEVVRCKNCKYCASRTHQFYCVRHIEFVAETDFCSDGAVSKED